MKDSIYRDGKGSLLSWMMTVDEASLICKELIKSGRKGASIAIHGEKGFGKSSILELLTIRTNLVVLEGDVFTILVRSIDQKLSGKLSDLAGLELKNGKNLWTNYSKEQASLLANKYFPGLGFCIDIMSAARGVETNHKVVIVPDYNGYVRLLKRRIFEMSNDLKKSKSFRDHVIETHKVLSYTEFASYISETIIKLEAVPVVHLHDQDDALVAQVLNLVSIFKQTLSLRRKNK